MNRSLTLSIASLMLMIVSCGKTDTSAIEARLDAVEKVSIASLQSQMSQINTTIGNLQATQSQLSGFVTNLQTSVGTLEGNYSSLNTAVDNLGKQDAKFEKDIADLAKAVDDCGKDVKKWVEESYTTLAKFGELQEEVSTIKTNIQIIFSRLDGLDSETKRISDGLRDLSTDLNEKLGKCNNEIDGIKKELKALQDDMDTVKAQIAAIVSSVQSVVVVPDYSDGSVKLSKAADNKVRFELYPLEAAESIAKTGPSILSLDYVETLTKSSEEFVNLPVTDVAFTGKTLLVTVDGTGLPDTIIEGMKTASARLRLSDGTVTRSSEYFPIYRKESGSGSQQSGIAITGDALDIGDNSATLYGWSNQDGSEGVSVVYGFEYSSTDLKTAAITVKASEKDTENKYSCLLTNLAYNTLYYYRAFTLYNGVRTYGEVKTFKTLYFPVSSISLDRSSATIKEGESITLVATVTPAEADNKAVRWSSSSDDVATVDACGKVTGVKAGSATITATAEDGGMKATCALSVEANPSVTVGVDHVSAISVVLQGKANLGTTAASDLQIGFQYSKSAGIMPSNSTTAMGEDADANYNYTSNVTGLEPATTYYFRSFIRQNGQDTYGETKEFTTKDIASLLETKEATGVEATTATLNAKLDLTDVQYERVEYGFLWGIFKENLDKDFKCTEIRDNTISATLKNIFHQSQYWYKSYVNLDSQTFYGEVKTFTTVGYTAVAGEAVDLGLSVKWASCNLGATSPSDYGDYFAWGETGPKNYCDWSTYKWCNGSSSTLTKYNNSSSYGTVDNKTEFKDYDYEDDAARQALGGKWRMPTDAEWTELRTQCTWTWVTNYNGSGINGKLVKATNGNSIFLPAAGYRSGTNLNYDGSNGFYWSSSRITGNPDYAWYVCFNSGGVGRDNDNRYYGLSVRPVSE